MHPVGDVWGVTLWWCGFWCAFPQPGGAECSTMALVAAVVLALNRPLPFMLALELGLTFVLFV